MATQTELNVKLKVDSSGVRTGTDEAKRKVKDAADSMAQNVKQSSTKMEDSMKGVSRATDGVADATRTATNAVRQMEGQVSSSASKMKKDLSDVASQMKGVSARQAAGVAAQGLRVAGNAVNWIGENFTEEGSTGRDIANVGGGALNGAASGVMLGAAVGSIIPGLGTAVGAALGGAVGALIGAASALWDASQELKKSAAERQKNAETNLQAHATDLKTRERFAGYERENQVYLNGLGKTWWQSKDGRQSYSGEDRVFQVQELRQRELANATERRDQFVREHQNDTGDAAVEAANRLQYLDRAVQEAQEHLQALAPVVEAARRSQEAQRREADEAAKATERERRAREDATARLQEAAEKEQIKGLNEEKRSAEHTMAQYERELQGVASKPAETPTDQLTRIGGGGGYASYNNSTAQIQRNIENYLKTLISNQKSQIQEVVDKLDALVNKDTTLSWA